MVLSLIFTFFRVVNDFYFFRVVSGSRDATLRMWDISTGECLHVLMGHVAAVRCVQVKARPFYWYKNLCFIIRTRLP